MSRKVIVKIDIVTGNLAIRPPFVETLGVGVDYSADSVKRPQYFGTLTSDIVWKGIAPGVSTELKPVIPKKASGRRKATLSQALTRNIGYPKLREHLGATVAYMTVSPDYPTFIKTLDAHRPRFNDHFEYCPEEDDGKGL